MSNEITKALQSGLEVSVAIDLLQPIQIGVCREKLDVIRKIKHVSPIEIWPLENGRYAIMSGIHRTFDAYKLQKTEVTSVLYLPFSKSFEDKLGKSLHDSDREIILKAYEDKINRLPFLVSFFNLRGIVHISDLEKNIFETASELYIINNLIINSSNIQTTLP